MVKVVGTDQVREPLGTVPGYDSRLEQLFLLGVGGRITGNQEDIMKKLLTIGTVVFAASAFAGSAFAAEFYVVRDATTKKCTVVETKPTTTTTTIVDNGIFKTRTEAETGMKTMKVCTN
jgi:hypothetical protein